MAGPGIGRQLFTRAAWRAAAGGSAALHLSCWPAVRPRRRRVTWASRRRDGQVRRWSTDTAICRPSRTHRTAGCVLASRGHRTEPDRAAPPTNYRSIVSRETGTCHGGPPAALSETDGHALHTDAIVILPPPTCLLCGDQRKNWKIRLSTQVNRTAARRKECLSRR